MSVRPKYRRPDEKQWVAVDRWDSTYWSGEQVSVYANDVLLDSVQLGYQVLERVAPYYGYASFVPDAMRHGTRIVSGELTLNFKRYNFLYSLLEYLRQGGGSMALRGETVEEARTDGVDNATTGASLSRQVRPPVPFGHQVWGEHGLSELKNLSAKEMRRVLEARGENLGRNERAINTPDGEGRFRPVVQTNLGMFQTREMGFDINIVHGGRLASAIALRMHSEDSYSLVENSTHEIAYNPNPATGLKLVSVSLQGVATVLDDSGRPIAETYSFQARDVQPLTYRDMENNQ